jgi:hypothetical protein
VRRFVKWALLGVAALAALAAVALAAVPYLVDTPRVHALVTTTATQALGRPVRFASLSIRVLPLPAVELRGLEVAEDPRFGTEPFLRLERGRVRLRVGPLLTGRVELGDVTLDRPVLTIVQSADGRLNVATLGSGPETQGPAAPPARGGGAGASAAALGGRVAVEGGSVTWVARGRGGAVARYRVEDLDLALAGGGPQLTFSASARVKPGDVSVKISDGVLGLGQARTPLEAPLAARVAVDGRDVTEVVRALAGPTPAVGGALRAALTVGGTLGAPTATGTVDVTRLGVTTEQPRCSEPRRRTLAIPSLTLAGAWQNQRLTGRPLAARLGEGTLTAQLTVSLERGARVEVAELALKAIPLEKVLVDYLCAGYALAGPLDLTGALAFAGADPLGTLSGPGRLTIGRGRVVGPQALALVGGVVRVGGAVSALLAADLPPTLFNSPLEFDSITGTYQVTNGVVTTRDLLYTSRAMVVSTAGTYALPTGALDLDLTVRHGRGEIRAKVTGTAGAPSIRVVPSGLLRDVERGRSGLGDFLRRLR